MLNDNDNNNKQQQQQTPANATKWEKVKLKVSSYNIFFIQWAKATKKKIRNKGFA